MYMKINILVSNVFGKGRYIIFYILKEIIIKIKVKSVILLYIY